MTREDAVASTNEIVEHSAVELRRMIGTRQLSPVELLDACIDRIEALNPAINAVCATDFDRAREQAKADADKVVSGEPLGLLHGLPVGVKDLQDTKGLLTTYGSPLYKDHVPDADTDVVARVRAAGANLFCKTNTPTFGAGANSRNPVWGATGNPFNPILNAGGSSGGSAAGLAVDMMPLATGSDTGGSLRIPASYCGVVGFRPSPGTVPVGSRPFGWLPISVTGPLARNVADTCLLMAAQAAFEAGDPLSYPQDPMQYLAPEPVDIGGLRAAFSTDLGFAPIDQDYREDFAAKIGPISAFFGHAEQADPDLGEVDKVFDVIRGAVYLARFREEYERDPDSLGPNPKANYEIAMAMTLGDHAWAHAEQTRAYHEFQTFFERFDVLITPTVPISPFPWEQLALTEMNGETLRNYYHWLAPTYGISITGHPAISIPCGVDRNGMPFGLQVVGPHRGDRFVLGVAHALEQAFAGDPSLARPVPNLTQLAEPTPALVSIVTDPPSQAFPARPTA